MFVEATERNNIWLEVEESKMANSVTLLAELVSVFVYVTLKNTMLDDNVAVTVLINNEVAKSRSLISAVAVPVPIFINVHVEDARVAILLRPDEVIKYIPRPHIYFQHHPIYQ